MQGHQNEPYTNSSDADYFRPFVCRGTYANISNLEQLKSHALQKVSNLVDVIQYCSRTDALKTIVSQVAAASAIGKGLESINDSDQHTFKVQQHFASNCHFKTQKRAGFFSTKGKPGRKKIKLTLHKPDFKEMEELSDCLSQVVPKTCAICLSQEVNSTDDDALWQKCASCDILIHTKCDQTGSPDGYRCKF